ncbi:ATP-binding protein [Cupriavidus sp. PET2-C1]
MFLVNVGTNKQRPSRRITEIDPREGAAVVGPNGVGKTTTLRLTPLFYGHLPSQIIQIGHGQKSMPRFTLPTPESAIVFEYQRGPSEAHDLRLAVLRARRDNPDALEYRLFESGFRREIFVDEHGTFLDDEGSKAAATNIGVVYSMKLDASEYRSIILNLHATTKQAHKLRQIAREYSFAPRAMPNLDRLVGSVVKEHVSFADLIQVAVGMVNEETNANSDSERNKLLLKQTKTEITDWIKNRRACEDAGKVTSAVDELDSTIDRCYREEDEIRLLAAEVSALLHNKTEALVDVTGRQENAAKQRRLQQESEQDIQTTLNTALEQAQANRRAAGQAYSDQAALKKRFDTEDVAGWAKKQESIQGLQAERAGILQQRQVYSAEAAIIDDEIRAAREEIDAIREADLETLNREAAENRERRAAQLESLNSQKNASLEGARGRHAEQATANQGKAIETRVALEGARIGSARVEGPEEDRALVNELRDQVDAIKDSLVGARSLEVARNQESAAARERFTRLDQEVASVQEQIADIGSEIARLERSLKPEDGTLLAAIRREPTENWENLAKVIDPQHLARTDLSPTLEGSSDPTTAFGWSLDVEKLAMPAWADEEEICTQIEQARQRLASANVLLTETKSRREAASANITSAHEAFLLAQSQVSVLAKNQSTKELSLAKARDALEQAKKAERGRLAETISRLTKELKALDQAQAEHVASAKQELQRIESRFDSELWNAGIAAKSEASDFDSRREAIKKQAANQVAALTARRNERLRAHNLDPEKFEKWDARRREIDGILRTLENKAVLVEQWRAWLTSNGPAELIRLEEAACDTNTALSKADAAIKGHEFAVQRAIEAYRVQQKAFDEAIADLTDQINKLKALEAELPPPMHVDVSIDPGMTAAQLAINVSAAQSKYASTTRRITELHNTIYNRLTAGENNVKEFVERSVAEVSNDRIEKARALVRCHRNIPAEIVANLNNTLRVILDTIERFHSAILSFETEIKRFNKNLGKGLQSVQQFERIRGLEIEMVTDFSDLGFMERLKQVSKFASETHFTLGRAGQRRQVPDDAAEIVLHEFANTIASGGRLEVDLSQHIRIRGKVLENEVEKTFHRESELENVSSNGLTSIILITLLLGMLNMIRGTDDVYITWVTDEVGKFDGPNFIALMDMLRDNRIDVITASPDLNPRHYRKFAQRYRLEDMGVIRTFAAPKHDLVTSGEIIAIVAGDAQ